MKDNSKPKVKIYAQAVGRRKEAVARVRLVPGNGDITVNDRPVQVYFPGPANKMRYLSPLAVLSDAKKYNIEAKVAGGGSTGQLDALTLGLARAITQLKGDHRGSLRAKGLLTRDSRIRQRRMVGMGGKSRRRKQSPKR